MDKSYIQFKFVKKQEHKMKIKQKTKNHQIFSIYGECFFKLNNLKNTRRNKSFMSLYAIISVIIIYQMQRQCKFGAKCWNKTQCKYFHPKNQEISQKFCRFGQKCRYLPACSFYHPISKKAEEQIQKNTENYVNKGSNLETRSEPDRNQVQVNTFGQTTQSSKELTVYAKTEKLILNNQNQKNNSQTNFYDNHKFMGKFDKISKSQSKSSQLNALNLIHTGQQQYLESVLQQFFNVRLVKNNIFDIIYAIISEHFSLEEVSTVIQFIEKLEESQLAAHFTYLKIVKTIARKGLNYQAICQQLQKQQKIRLLKQQKYANFVQQIPNLIKYSVITDSQIMQFQEQIRKEKNKKRLKFLIDGDNVINTHKVLRKYYRNRDRCIQIQGQIRLRWLLSEQEDCVLFFDQQKGSQQKYWQIADKIMYQQEIEKIKLQKWIFANQFNQQSEYQEQEQHENQQQKQQNDEQSQNQGKNQQQEQKYQYQTEQNQNKNTADECILKWLSENTHKNQLNQQKQKNINLISLLPSQTIILISGDRILIQKCLQIQPQIKISSGKFFIKYCKEHIRRKYYGNKNKKAVIKRIFIQPRVQN